MTYVQSNGTAYIKFKSKINTAIFHRDLHAHVVK